MKESYIIFWEQNDTPACRGEEVKWGLEGGEGSLRFANRNFYVFFFEGFCRDEFYANIMM